MTCVVGESALMCRMPVDAAHARQPDIQQDDIRARVGPERGQRLLAGGEGAGALHGRSPIQHAGQHAAGVGMIFNQPDHGLPPEELVRMGLFFAFCRGWASLGTPWRQRVRAQGTQRQACPVAGPALNFKGCFHTRGPGAQIPKAVAAGVRRRIESPAIVVDREPPRLPLALRSGLRPPWPARAGQCW